MGAGGDVREYQILCYRAAEDAPWFHFLHGNVPFHQIDFMYRPEVPQGQLDRQHYSHLARLLDYIEPRGSEGYAFAIGNLSRDDTQHEPGHGGVALIFGLRVRGITDHAGRPDPPFAHAAAAIDRALDAATLFQACIAFQRRVLGGDAGSAEWYRSYVRAASESSGEVARMLAAYVASFDDLPRLAPSAASLAWTTDGAQPAGRVVLVHADDAPFADLALAASRIAAVLYRSDVRWSVISNGREADLPNGVSVRFVPRSAVGSGEAATIVRALEDIPEEEDAIARELFGARPVGGRGLLARWRDRFAGSQGGAEGEKVTPLVVPTDEIEIEVTLETPASAPHTADERCVSGSMRPSAPACEDADAITIVADALRDDSTRPAAPSRPVAPTGCSPEKRLRLWVALAIATLCGAIALAFHAPAPAPTSNPTATRTGAPALVTAPSSSQQPGPAYVAPEPSTPLPREKPAPSDSGKGRSSATRIDTGSFPRPKPPLGYHPIPDRD